MFFAMLFCGEKAWYAESDNSVFVKEDKLMIKKIAIVPYVTNGRNSQVGHDGHFNILKKREVLY